MAESRFDAVTAVDPASESSSPATEHNDHVAAVVKLPDVLETSVGIVIYLENIWPITHHGKRLSIDQKSELRHPAQHQLLTEDFLCAT